MWIIKSALQLTKQNLMFINCYFQEAFNEDIGTTQSVQQQNLFIVSNVLILKSNKLKAKLSLHRPLGPHEVEPPRFLDKWHMKMARLSALCIGHLYPKEIFPAVISVRG